MVVHAYFPLAEPRVQREAAAARDAGFAVTVLALRGDGEPARETVDGIEVHRIRLSHRRGAGLGRILYEYVAFCLLASMQLAAWSARDPFDLVHVHNPPDFLILAGLLPRARGARLILDVHDLSSHMFAVRVGGLLGRIACRILAWIERAACAVADHVITVHEPYRAELIGHGVEARKVAVVMNGADERILRRASAMGPAVERSASFRVAYHGTLTWWYGADLIVEAVARLRADGMDVDVVILGDGDQVPHLREEVRRRRLSGCVHISGRYLPIEAALASVAVADCGVIPNRPSQINRFALSSKLLEYVALGVPVVVARLETLAAHFGEDEVTFFDAGDAGALAEAVRWVHQHPREARARAVRAQRRAERYAWSRSRATLQQLYDRLLSDGRPVRGSA